LETQVVAVRKKTPAQFALEKELKERNPVLIQELKDVRKQINDLKKQCDALQQELDDNKAALRLIPTGEVEDVEM
jgi:FtsZ-binding cell division protein ZapB